MKRSSKWWKQLQDPLSIKLPARAHVPLVRCRVQLLGRAAPADIADGLHAIQKPLHELFECYSPVESILTAYTSGLVVRTPADVDVGVEELWFPIQDLMECGAMRPIGGHPPTAFAPISTLEAQATKGPAIFAFCFKRRDIPVSDCWAVQCQSDDAAMALLSACMMAHKNPAGWGSAVDRPPSTIPTKNASRAPRSEEWDGAVAKDAALWSNKFQRDYYEKPPLQGFYYTPSPGLIQHYALGEMMQYFVEEEMPENGESLMPDAEDSQQPIQPEEVSYLRQPGNRNHRPSRFPEDAYYPSSMNGRPARGAPVVYPNQTDMYGQPIGSMGSFVPESLIFPDDKYTSSSDSDAHHGKKHDKHKKKKKSKKSRHGKDQKWSRHTNGAYQYYADDGMVIVPQEAMQVYCPPSSISEEPFDRQLPGPVDHYVAEPYDPAWQYDMKSHIRDQQYVSGFTDPVARAYESHIDQFPPADYDDEGPYERRLPVAGGRAVDSDPNMLNRNFIIRQSEDYRRRV